MEQDQVQKIHEMLDAFDTAMLVTRGKNDSFAHARPMAIAWVEPNCNVWFFTGRGSPKVAEIQNDDEVLVLCQDEHARYVSLYGRAELVADRRKTHELWRTSYGSWFPGGVDDPELLLICVHPSEAEYWHSGGSDGLRYLFHTAGSRV